MLFESQFSVLSTLRHAARRAIPGRRERKSADRTAPTGGEDSPLPRHTRCRPMSRGLPPDLPRRDTLLRVVDTLLTLFRR